MVVYLSCMCSKGLDISVVYGAGKCLSKQVEHSKYKDVKTDLYYNLINTYVSGLKQLRSVVQNNDTDITEVVIETNNSIFKKWLTQGYPLDKYSNEFLELLEILNSIPMKYSIIYNKNIRCRCYADIKYCKREKLTGIE